MVTAEEGVSCMGILSSLLNRLKLSSRKPKTSGKKEEGLVNCLALEELQCRLVGHLYQCCNARKGTDVWKNPSPVSKHLSVGIFFGQ